MVQVVIRCVSCGTTSPGQELTVRHSTPRWARALWRMAFQQGWRRSAQHNAAIFCPPCVARLPPQDLVPSMQPRRPLIFPMIVVLRCDIPDCPGQYEGTQTELEHHYNLRLRQAARLYGWRQVFLDQFTTHLDLCPTCAPNARADQRPGLMELVWSQPTTHVAAELGISSKAVEKRCRRAGVPKPPPGFWAKYHAGRMAECRDLVPHEVVQTLGRQFLDEVFPLLRDHV